MLDLKKLRSLDKDDLLELIGLETKRTAVDWILPTVAIFSVGFLVGAGLGLLLAPKPGHELREDLRNRLQGQIDELQQRYTQPQSSPSGNQQPSTPTY